MNSSTVAKTRELVRKVRSKFLEADAVPSKVVKSTAQRLQKLSRAALQSATRGDLEKLDRVLKSKLSEVETPLHRPF